MAKDDRKAVYVRMSEKTHRKLMRLVATQLRKTGAATKQGVIIDLIEQAKGA